MDSVSKQYSERPLLAGVSLQINEGDRIGLIGINGSGKTTLLRLIAGLEQPDEGQLTVWGGVRIEYLPQDPLLDDDLTVLEYLYAGHSPQLRLLQEFRETSTKLQDEPDDAYLQERLSELSDEMDRTGGWAAEANAKAILTRLGVPDFEARLATLSGGQGKRVALARALIDRADLLILDEPTNHIDADTIAWLEDYLTAVPGALLMVTHDRYFLSRVVNRIVELDRRELISYPGNYRHYLELRAQRHQRLVASEQKRQNLLRRELEWLRRGAMARSTKQKARKQRVEELQQIQNDRGDESLILALASRRLGKKVLESHGLSKSFGQLKLFEEVDFSLIPGDRIGIIGPNGAGKSTLLDVLAGLVEPDNGRVTWGETVQLGYYDQLSRGLNESRKVVDYINEKAALIQTKEGHRIEAAQMLEWFLFPRPQQQARISSLSGGERRRLYLLWVLAQQPNVLFLDEPTNDLDIQTLNVLEEFLDAFTGCLVVVSHDRYFLDRTVNFLATFENGSMSTRYPTPYSSYQRLRNSKISREETPRTKVKQPSRREVVQRGDEPKARKLTWKETRELESIETKIAQLEQQKKLLEIEINEAGSDYQLLQSLADQLQELEVELEKALTRWLELSEIGE